MTWPDDLHAQVLEAFRDAQRRPGELDTSDDEEAHVAANLEDREQRSAGGARRRIVTRRAAA